MGTFGWPWLAVMLAAAGTAAAAELRDADLVALTAVDLEAELAAGRVSAERVTRAFLDRIASLDAAGPSLHSVIELNPDALAIAKALDRRFERGGRAGPLHGLPVLLKANIDTADRLATSAGSLALANHHPAADAPLVERLRSAGAVILGKTNLSEWANFRSTHSTSGWSSLGGQTRNPYVLDRNPCGSSSGSAVAVAARLAPLAVGTETDGSIMCPAGANGVVGVKPTLGLVSQRGIVPIAASQDTAGPLARTVADAALLLRVIAGEAGAARAPEVLDRRNLEGVRLGVVRNYAGARSDAAVEAVFAQSLATLRAAGAEVVDPVEWPMTADVEGAELEILLVEFARQIDAYLRATDAGPHSLEELIAFDSAHAAAVMPLFGQDLFLAAAATRERGDGDYRAALATIAALRERLATLFAERSLDALVVPTNGPAWRTDPATGDRFGVGSSTVAAVSGYPSVTVPAGLAGELPLGLSLIGKPMHDAQLLAIAAVFEARRGPFPAPRFLATLDPSGGGARASSAAVPRRSVEGP